MADSEKTDCPVPGPYPWQDDVWRQLAGNPGQLPHALLLTGMAGIGKLDFARSLAQSLLCESPQPGGKPCGHCASCNWYQQGSHPDFRLLEPEALSVAADGSPEESEEKSTGKKASAYITVARIRELADFVNLSTHRNGLRVILVHPAESMNIQAANALLKTLEEPPPNTVFLLISHLPQRLLPTIRSRCRIMGMPLPARAEALRWLKSQSLEHAELCLAQAGYAPLRAVELGERELQRTRYAFLQGLGEVAHFDPIGFAEQVGKGELAQAINWIQTWVHDLVRLNLAGSIRYNLDFADRLQELGKRVNLMKLLAYQRELNEIQRVLQHPLNMQLLLESVFLSYQDQFASAG
jgi:DNA polymerase-3 subunit delta'